MTQLNSNTLFDSDQFDNNLASQSKTIDKITLYRETLHKLDEELFERFRNGAAIEDLVTGRAFAVDELIKRIWYDFLPRDAHNIALVAVGGYGRGELHPRSDIDIMVLLEHKKTREHDTAIQQFLTFLWDIKLMVGQSVRTVKDCYVEGKQDITIATNLMEARLLTGPVELFEQMRKITSPKKIWPSPKFFKAKWDEQKARHHQHHDTAYNLEPNVKEGPGGLRDIQMIGWVAKRHFAAPNLHDLVTHNYLTNAELHELHEGQSFLWKIRFALHMLTRRPEDRILFDHQKELAAMFGYKDSHVIAVEQFMQAYYKTVMSLERTNEMLLQLFEENILLAKKRNKSKKLSDEFQVNYGYLEVTDENVFKNRPAALMELFLELQTNPKLKGIRAWTIRLIRNSLKLIDDDFRQNPDVRKAFINILRQASGVTHVLRRMNRYGVLAAYLPEFANIVGRMQYDLFHVYTVDEHTLFVVRNMRRFTVPEFNHEFPFCSQIIETLYKPELLYIAGLYHDIAKGRGGDHSVLGAEDAKAFCLRHGLSEYDANLVAWLVFNHLIMSTTAQRKDISDPHVINEFATQVGDVAHLDYLYLLTVADIRATNPKLWNSWKASLLEELYRNTKNALQRGLDQPLEEEESIRETRDTAMNALRNKNHKAIDVEKFWSVLPKSFFIRYHPDEVVWVSDAVLSAAPDALPLIQTIHSPVRDSNMIFIYTADRDYLFASVTSKLEQLGLDILDARIITTKDGFALNTYTVLDLNGKAIKGERETKQISAAIRDRLTDQDLSTNLEVHRRPSRHSKFFDIQTEMSFELDPTAPRTIFKVRTADRPGLLSRIGQAFKDCEIRVQNARVATLGLAAEDTFLITDSHGKPLSEESQFERLRQCVLYKLSH